MSSLVRSLSFQKYMNNWIKIANIMGERNRVAYDKQRAKRLAKLQ